MITRPISNTYYGLPEKVVYCKRCTISNQRPSSVVEFISQVSDAKPTIQFDEHGICTACRYVEIKDQSIDWQAREQELIKLCSQFRSKSGYYDCIIPGSGGKDSSFTAHILKYKYGMNPLTVTWAPHQYTEIGWKNFQRWIHSGLDNILYTPNGKLHRLLTKLAFINLCHPFQPFIIGQRLIAPRFSVMYNIPLIFYGENQAEYGNNIEENNLPTMSPSFFEQQNKWDQIFLGGISIPELIEKYDVDQRDLNPYLPLDSSRLKTTATQVHYLGYYLKWDPQECYYYAAEHTGFEPNRERTEGSYSKYSSIDDKIDPLHYYTTFIKFGMGRASYDSSQEIRNKKITRDEGVNLVLKYDHEFPAKYFHEILEYMNISESQFWETINNARSPHLWEKLGDSWRLKHPIS